MSGETKRVRFRVSIASSEDWAYAPGQVVDLPADRADAFIASGTAAAVDEKAPAKGKAPETATAVGPEDASLPKGRKGVFGGR